MFAHRGVSPFGKGLNMKTKLLGAAALLAALGCVSSASATVIFQSTNDFGSFVNYGYCSGCLDNTATYSSFNISQSASIGSIQFAVGDITNQWTPLTTSITTTIYSATNGFAGAALYQQTVKLSDFAAKLQSNATPAFFNSGPKPIITYGENTPNLSLGQGTYFISFFGTYLGVPTFFPTINNPLTYQSGHWGTTPYHNSETVGFVLNSTSIPSVSAVPEPSTWAMMLFGFAGLGFVGYRRTKKSVAAHSVS